MREKVQHILHVDMDAFFAAIEQRDNPSLRGRPVIVGAPPDRRGVVATASYEARRYGIHSAMPSRTAGKLCPHGVFLPVRRERYRDVSRAVMAIFRDITPIVEPVSIDEAFLDLGPVRNLADATAAARRIKARIRNELGLTASVGVAVNKFLAKLASDLEKPDGLTVVPAAPEAIRAFLAPLPVRCIWGVGERTAERLARIGIRRIGHIQALDADAVSRALGHSLGKRIYQLAFGRDSRPVRSEPAEEKSISNERTFERDCTDPAAARAALLDLAEKVGRRLRGANKLAATVHVKIRFGDFRTITRQMPLPKPTHSDRDLLACARELWRREAVGKRPVRLVGFGVSDLRNAGEARTPRQLLLFPETETEDERRHEALDRALDDLRDRYGPRIIHRGWRNHGTGTPRNRPD